MNGTASRLWQIDARFMQFMQLKAAGLSPDSLDDDLTNMVAEWLGMDPKPIDWTEDSIPVVTVSGPLYKRKSPFASNYKSIGEALDSLLAMEIPPVAVVLKIDSPGGMVNGLDAVIRKVEQLAEQTLVVASIDGCGCSAAYRIAAAAGSVWATSDSDVGSIGTYWQFIDYSKAFEDAGLKSVLLTTGPFKGLGVPGEEITDEQIAFLQDVTDKTNAAFLADVKAGRMMSDAQVAAVSDGRFWMASEALELGLIDEIGGLSDVLTAIRSQYKESTQMAKKTLRPASAQASDETPEVTDQVDPAEVDNDDVTPATVTDETPATTATPEARGLGDYMAAFGDAEGARMFLQGVSWDQAQAQTISGLRGQIQDMQAETAQLKSRLTELGKQFTGGEDKPLATGETPKHKSFGEACRAAKKK